MAATTSLIKTEIVGAVGVAHLNRPEALNALNHPLMDQLEAALEGFEKEPAVRAIVIAGSERAFAAGADIKEMDTKNQAEMSSDNHLSRWDKVGRLTKPTIAAVSGFALGGGCELALACDMIVASESAVFAQPEINLGVIPGAGGTVRLAKAVGKALAMEMVLAGRKLSAREALALGLVNRVVPVESYLSEALKLAEQVAAQPPIAVSAAKASVLRAVDLATDDALMQERLLFWALFDTEDQKEGMKAFVEKRKPKFTGR